MMRRVITANRLTDGAVVYWADGSWVEMLDDASRLEDESSCQSALALAEESVGRQEVVSPYWIDIQPVTSGNSGVESHEVTSAWVPVRYREVIRAHGPSVHLHFGKQARLGRKQSG